MGFNKKLIFNIEETKHFVFPFLIGVIFEFYKTSIFSKVFFYLIFSTKTLKEQPPYKEGNVLYILLII
jgi:hypothetical protein